MMVLEHFHMDISGNIDDFLIVGLYMGLYTWKRLFGAVLGGAAGHSRTVVRRICTLGKYLLKRSRTYFFKDKKSLSRLFLGR